MSFPAVTPQHLVIAARAAAPLCLGGLAWAVLWMACTPTVAAAGFLLSASVLLMGAPRIRAGDLVGALLVFITVLECIHAGASGTLDGPRWQACVAAAGTTVLLLKIQHLRGLARQDAYVPLRHLERRNALFGRTAPGRRAA